MARSRIVLVFLLCFMIGIPPFLSSTVVQAADHTYIVDTPVGTSVTTCADGAGNDNDCSFSGAIQRANSDLGSSEIVFNIPGDNNNPDYNSSTGRWTIKPSSQLTLTEANTTIDGKFFGSQLNAPSVIIDGSSGSGWVLRLVSASNTISNLVVVNGTSGGIQIRDLSIPDGIAVTGNKLYGLYVGVLPQVSTASANNGPGIQLAFNTSNNIIGGVEDGQQNFVAGNTGVGISLTDVNNNAIVHNFIGVNLVGASYTAVPNAGGIELLNSSSNTVGGTAPLSGNVVSGNTGYGVKLTDLLSSNNSIAGNYIGVNSLGSVALPNAGPGVLIEGGATNNTISGSNAVLSVISGNTGPGIQILDAESSNNKIEGVFLGISSSGLFAVPNSVGIQLTGGTGTVIGAANSPNIVSGNTGDGIVVGSAAVGTVIASNIIGLNRTSIAKIPNGGSGIVLNGTATVGGSTAAAGNTIAGNTANGIRVQSTSATTATLQFNTIGTALVNTAYLAGLGNGANGVLVSQASAPVQILNSTVYSNTLSGVKVTGTTQKVKILSTSFTANGIGQSGDDAKAIALVGTTVGAAGTPTLPNHDIDPPSQLRVNESKQVTGRVQVTSTNACITCTVQFFAANPLTLDGEGKTLLSVTGFTINATGMFTATLPYIPAQLAATATDITGNTSEFATLVVVPSIDIAVGEQLKQAAPSETISYTFRLTNTGTLDLNDLKLTAGSDKNWTIKIEPATMTLRSGRPAENGLPAVAAESKPVTLTLTLPAGTDPRVIAGTRNTSYISVTSTLVPTATDNLKVYTDVLSKFVLKTTPTSGSKSGVSTDENELTTVEYSHNLENTGNLTGTLTIAATTDLFKPEAPENWKTTVTTNTVTIGPGQSKPFTVQVQVPYGAAAGTIARTTVKVTQVFTDSTPPVSYYYTDTTTISPYRIVTIYPSATGNAAAGAQATLRHTVVNQGNATSQYTLSAESSQGSTVTFVRVNGPALDSSNTFTLGTTDTTNVLIFDAIVTVNPLAFRGDIDTITITVTDSVGAVVGSVQDRVTVSRALVAPRLYAPMVTLAEPAE